MGGQNLTYVDVHDARDVTVPGPPPEQSIRIAVPAKTQLYVDNTRRERDTAITMHRTFQRDLFRLKLLSARQYAKALQANQTPVVTSIQVSLRVNVEVLGMGPVFKVIVALTNTTEHAIEGLRIAMTCDTAMYVISHGDPCHACLCSCSYVQLLSVQTCIAMLLQLLSVQTPRHVHIHPCHIGWAYGWSWRLSLAFILLTNLPFLQ